MAGGPPWSDVERQRPPSAWRDAPRTSPQRHVLGQVVRRLGDDGHMDEVVEEL